MSFEVGDRVVYSQAHLQSITGGDPHSEMWSRIGTVRKHVPPFIEVQWDCYDEPSLVSPVNIARLGDDYLERVRK